MKAARIIAARQGLMACQHCGIRHLALFADLHDSDFDLIHLPIEEIGVEPMEQIYHLDQAATAIFTLRAGLVKLVHIQPDGSQRIVRLIRPGGVVGLEALVRPHYEHLAVALLPVELCRIPVSVVRQLQTNTPRLHQKLMEKWHEALSVADDFLTGLSTGSARQRLARLLLTLSEEAPDQPVRLFTREDFGAILAVTLETASRTVSDLKRSGAIREVAHNLVICDRVALQAAAEGM
ncbi:MULTISPECIES: Crp/Fnr family transcriptional regulator [unclassified Azospirillum]|uniref:Crp/Fnr family transcriptional regulator n=1 Tax=unclassified Azospirillum TaxID=2630922 RepID=UPI000B6E3C94|nr:MULTISPECIES: Crp/Fnr family transcriptional regulator [unclassified Azospirillum]SNS46376.1 cAMP-binding domain of CRP or a regulatory subunit of cAMP-dependent protein kinases [Azospirillum sp. RU38E]SNS65528.1 cAMP-binding domain of CRP or a regulatory subunit of cAMP-dependent protein kinases [Azospirillum sp. RU37A]